MRGLKKSGENFVGADRSRVAAALQAQAFHASDRNAVDAAQALIAAGVFLLAEAVGDEVARAQLEKLSAEFLGGVIQ